MTHPHIGYSIEDSIQFIIRFLHIKGFRGVLADDIHFNLDYPHPNDPHENYPIRIKVGNGNNFPTVFYLRCGRDNYLECLN